MEKSNLSASYKSQTSSDTDSHDDSNQRALELSMVYRQVRQTSEDMIGGLNLEDCSSTLSWHLAHSSWLFENLILKTAYPDYQVFDGRFDTLFHSDKSTDKHEVDLDNIFAYRTHVDRHVLALLHSDGVLNPELCTNISRCIHQERRQQEQLLVDLKYLLWSKPAKPVYRAFSDDLIQQTTDLTWHAYPEGLRRQGTGRTDDSFHFPNEFPRHRVFLDAFEIASRPVTCGEYLAFMDDGGYQREDLWLREGWRMGQQAGWKSPLYWQQDGPQWHIYTLSGIHPMNPHEPVCHLSYYEAAAYAQWCDAQLPTEAQWEIAATNCSGEGIFSESGHLHPIPSPASGLGLSDMFGNVWEWTSSSFSAYPGYIAPAGDPDRSMMSDRLVLRGGSCASPEALLHPGYRHFLKPHSRRHFSGIRLARNG